MSRFSPRLLLFSFSIFLFFYCLLNFSGKISEEKPPKVSHQKHLDGGVSVRNKDRLRTVQRVCTHHLTKQEKKEKEKHFGPFTAVSLKSQNEEEGYKILAKNPSDLSHIIVDEEHKLLYCYVPKVACTNWKKLMMILSKKIDETNPQNILGDLVHRNYSLVKLSQFKEDEILHRLSSYSKFMFAREPIERLLSAFRNKLQSRKSTPYFRRRYGIEIQKMFREDPLTRSPSGDGTTFSEFVRYLTQGEGYVASRFNEHWMPMVKLCQPCLVRYDYIGKYETLAEDSETVLRTIGAPEGLSMPPHRSKTQSLLGEALSDLSEIQMKKLQEIFAEDSLMFGYSFEKQREVWKKG